ncbi:hypothetical protein [endosymbiont GvMRE of Glomus versiforme]|uniref:hypothetical protein n=1 Tax=endosymbiont GvMRE of Glomus versiforme TaxID=2039283 RepID=UPI0011C44449|nr:hypothetical protein [endosymbiont GvMRE of Glomus versiforme]
MVLSASFICKILTWIKPESKKFVLFKLDKESKLLRKLDSVKLQSERKDVQSIFENNLELIFPSCILIKSEFIFPYKIAEKDKRVDTVAFFDDKKNVKTFLLFEYKKERTDKITVQTSAYIKNLVGGNDIISIQNRFSLLTLLNNKLLENNKRPRLFNLNDINWEKIKGICVSPEYYDYQIVGHRSHQESEEKIILVKLNVYEENIFCIESQDLPEWLKIGSKSSVNKTTNDDKKVENENKQEELEYSRNDPETPLDLFDERVEKIIQYVTDNFSQLLRRGQKKPLRKTGCYYFSYFLKVLRKGKKRAILTVARRERTLQLYLNLKSDEFSQNLIENFHLKETFSQLGSPEMNRRMIIKDNDDFEKSFALLQDYIPYIDEKLEK